MRRLSLFQRRDDILDGGFGGKVDRRALQAEALGAQADLGDGLLAGNIDDAVAGFRDHRRRLDQQRRFADAGIAADENGRTLHEPASGHAVEFGQ